MLETVCGGFSFVLPMSQDLVEVMMLGAQGLALVVFLGDHYEALLLCGLHLPVGYLNVQ